MALELPAKPVVRRLCPMPSHYFTSLPSPLFPFILPSPSASPASPLLPTLPSSPHPHPELWTIDFRLRYQQRPGRWPLLCGSDLGEVEFMELGDKFTPEDATKMRTSYQVPPIPGPATSPPTTSPVPHLRFLVSQGRVFGTLYQANNHNRFLKGSSFCNTTQALQGCAVS